MRMATGPLDKKNNILPTWGNEKTMNLNNMILTNILSSHYFKVNLYQLKTFHEVVDEIYYNVSHLEPWEKGSRKTSGQTGMCGGVRGVGAGGIVSTAFCILYKLFTLRLTRKQVIGLITHCDSPYIRGLGFMYIRYTQPPADLWDWYETYLTDEEEIDVKAGGGQVMTIGEMLRHFLCKLEWHSTLFPRTPVPIQKDIERKLSAFMPPAKVNPNQVAALDGDGVAAAAATVEDEVSKDDDWAPPEVRCSREDATRVSRKESDRNGRWSRDRQDYSESGVKERDRQHGKRNSPHSVPARTRHRSKDQEKERERERDRTHDREKDKAQDRDKERSRNREGSPSRERHHRNSESRHYERHHKSSSSKHKSSVSGSKHRSHSRDRSKHRRH